ncbi:hypothetical protein [Mycoplasma crocodyli]|nr:hypothetical protein [Mycoplasma crocodyli]
MKKISLITLGTMLPLVSALSIVSCNDTNKAKTTKELNEIAKIVTVEYTDKAKTLLSEATKDKVTFSGFDTKLYAITGSAIVKDATKNELKVSFSLKEVNGSVASDPKTLVITGFKIATVTPTKNKEDVLNDAKVELQKSLTDSYADTLKTMTDKDAQAKMQATIDKLNKELVAAAEKQLDEINKEFDLISLDNMKALTASYKEILNSTNSIVVNSIKDVVTKFNSGTKVTNGLETLKNYLTTEVITKYLVDMTSTLTQVAPNVGTIGGEILGVLTTDETTKDIKDIDKVVTGLTEYFKNEAFTNLVIKMKEVKFDKLSTDGYVKVFETTISELKTTFKTEAAAKLKTLLNNNDEDYAKVKKVLEGKYTFLEKQFKTMADTFVTQLRTLAEDIQTNLK